MKITFDQLRKLVKEALDDSPRTIGDWFKGDGRTLDFTDDEKKDFARMFKMDMVASAEDYDGILKYWSGVNKRPLKDAAGQPVKW